MGTGEMQSAALRTVAGVAGPFTSARCWPCGADAARRRRARGQLVFMSLTFSWLADKGAYFFGRLCGQDQAYEAVSPKKTRAWFRGRAGRSQRGRGLASLWYLPGYRWLTRCRSGCSLALSASSVISSSLC